MTTNHLRRIFAAMLLLLALCGLGACTIVVPDWDDTKR